MGDDDMEPPQKSRESEKMHSLQEKSIIATGIYSKKNLLSLAFMIFSFAIIYLFIFFSIMNANIYAWDMNVFLLLTELIAILTSTKYKHAIFAFG